jgi:hypothetical protein
MSPAFVGGGVVAAGGGFTPVWKYLGDHTPASGDSVQSNPSIYHLGGLITAPTGSSKISSIRTYIDNDGTSITLWLCVYPATGGTALGGSSGGNSTNATFQAVEVSGLNITVTPGTSYLVTVSSQAAWDQRYYSTGTGKFTNDAGTASCGTVASPSDDPGFLHSVGVYFE